MKEFAMPTRKFGAETTAMQVVADVDLHGRRALVTGASSGIGVETARALASAGAAVTERLELSGDHARQLGRALIAAADEAEKINDYDRH
jgi:NAD(P)-dependent dehydrogenase (short-subunit alcohol dehydrogenase family)